MHSREPNKLNTHLACPSYGNINFVFWGNQQTVATIPFLYDTSCPYQCHHNCSQQWDGEVIERARAAVHINHVTWDAMRAGLAAKDIVDGDGTDH